MYVCMYIYTYIHIHIPTYTHIHTAPSAADEVVRQCDGHQGPHDLHEHHLGQRNELMLLLVLC